MTEKAKTFLLQDRRLNELVIEGTHIGSGYSPSKGDYVTFNYFLDFKHVNTKYRGIAQKAFHMETGAQLCLYNGDALKTAKEYAIIAEGEIDALSWMSAGFVFSTSVPNGASNNTSYLDPHIYEFDHIETVYISGDQDPAGYNLALTLADRIGRDKCKLVGFPIGIKDANECLQRYGQEQGRDLLRECFENAKPFPVEGVETVHDHLDESYTYLVNGYPETLDIGVPGLCMLMSLFPSEVTIITGAPGSGKSNLVDVMMVNLMDKHDMRMAVVSAEKSTPLHITGLVKKHCQSAIVPGEEALRALEKLNDYMYYISGDAHYSCTLGHLMIKALIIDNLSCVDQSGYSSMSDGAAAMMAKIKSLAKKYRLIIFLVAHPRKLQSNANGFELPNGYDILGSSHFYNLADNIIAMALRDDFVEVATRKVKNMEFVSPLGKLGTRELVFDRAKGGLYRTVSGQELEMRKQKEDEVFDLF